MTNSILNALVSALIGVIAFVIIKQIVDSQSTTNWTGAEQAIIGIIPIVLGIMIVVGMFMGLSRVRGE